MFSAANVLILTSLLVVVATEQQVEIDVSTAHAVSGTTTTVTWPVSPSPDTVACAVCAEPLNPSAKAKAKAKAKAPGKRAKKAKGKSRQKAKAGKYPVTRVRELTYVAFNVTSRAVLKRAVKLFESAGLVAHRKRGSKSMLINNCIYMRGLDTRSHSVELRLLSKAQAAAVGGGGGGGIVFAGIGFSVAERRHVHDLAKFFYPAQHSKGRALRKGGSWGGEHVVVWDPNGIRVEVRFGARSSEDLELPETVPSNGAQWKGRQPGTRRPRVWQPQPQRRRQPAVPRAWRLGYVTLRPRLGALGETMLWYRQHLGLLVSDALTLPAELSSGNAAGSDKREPVVAYLRLDLGADPADHHSIVLDSTAVAANGAIDPVGSVADVDARGGHGYVGAAFEVDSVDEVAAGQIALQHFAQQAAGGALGLAAVAAAGPFGAMSRRTFGSTFAHSTALMRTVPRPGGAGNGGGIYHPATSESGVFERICDSGTNATRVDCGSGGVDEGRCEALGCCWSPTEGRPPCFVPNSESLLEGRALASVGQVSHFTDMDVLAQMSGGGGDSDSLGCHVFNASGLVQWGFGAESTGNVGQVVSGTSAVLQAALRN